MSSSNEAGEDFDYHEHEHAFLDHMCSQQGDEGPSATDGTHEGTDGTHDGTDGTKLVPMALMMGSMALTPAPPNPLMNHLQIRRG